MSYAKQNGGFVTPRKAPTKGEQLYRSLMQKRESIAQALYLAGDCTAEQAVERAEGFIRALYGEAGAESLAKLVTLIAGDPAKE